MALRQAQDAALRPFGKLRPRQAQGAALRPFGKLRARQAQDMAEKNPDLHAIENVVREALGHPAPPLSEVTDA